MPRKSFGKNFLATLRFQPSNRGLVMDLQQAVFVRYVGFAFKWNSSLSTLHLTVDYSLDGIHWNDYVEDERVKVKQFYVLVLHKRSHYEVSRRIYKSAKLTTMAEKTSILALSKFIALTLSRSILSDVEESLWS